MAEKEYIEREAAIMTAMDYDGDGNAQDASQDIASALGDIPAADVKPVVRGKWISSDRKGHKVGWDDMNPGCPAESCYCSVCGDWLTASDEYLTRGNFCPNCGADMRGW